MVCVFWGGWVGVGALWASDKWRDSFSRANGASDHMSELIWLWGEENEESWSL